VVGERVLGRVAGAPSVTPRSAAQCLKKSDTVWSSISTMQATISALIGIIEGFQSEKRRSSVSMA
jgi:hypothetical protein